MSERMESMLGADREDNAEAHFSAVHSHRHLFFHSRKRHRETCRSSKLCHFSLRSFVELKPFAKDTVEHSPRKEAVQPTQHHAFAYRVMQTW